MTAKPAETYRARPEPGQLVEVRRRQWIVAEISGQDSNLHANSQTFVKLTSLDEDALGEELEVIWEIEPGAGIIERAGLPSLTGQDDPDTLDAFLDAVRWGAVTNADRGFLQAPFRSGVSIEDFQLDPLVRAIDMARVNLLIADDVGLGKTIEAGLILQEMFLRHRARTALIICPASLQEKWRTEMLEKFGLEFRIVDTEYIHALRRERGIHANPWTSFPRLITSMDWAKSGEAMRALRDVLPARNTFPRRFDMLVIDEAHNVAPAAGANYALESQRTRFIRMLAPHFQHRLFLTATPHNGYTESFTSLLELLDDQRFARTILPDENQLKQVMIRRLKSDLVDAEGRPIYPKRVLEALPVDYSSEERRVHAKLREYCASREESVRGTSRSFGTAFINQLLKKRLLSSPAAFASTLEKHLGTSQRAGNDSREQRLDERILRKAILRAEEDYADDTEAEIAQEEAVAEATQSAVPFTDKQSALLKELRDWAQQARHRPDSKATAVLNWLEANLRPNGVWNNRRVILFTEYRTTHQWMHEILVAHGFGGDRLAVLHGGLTLEEREPIKAAFQADPSISPVRIMLATDAASEGIDLQNHCNMLIHLEIPYNPNVMEQRNGRIDRHGQREREVRIWHPVDCGEDETGTVGGHGEDILRALRKLDSMRADMGSVNPVIAPQLSGLIEGSRRDLDVRAAEERAARSRRYVQAERSLNERIRKLHERLLATRDEFHLTPKHVLMAVKTALVLAGRPPLEPVDLAGAPSGSAWRLPALTGSWARCAEGLEHPFHRGIRPVTFDHEVAKGRDDVVLVHLNHRLVQMSLRLLRAEVWAREDVKKLHRISVRTVPATLLDGPAVVAVSRLVVTGGHHHRLHEELTWSGGYLREQGYKREEGIARVQEWMDQAKPLTASASLMDALRARYERSQGPLLQTIEARSRERLKGLSGILDSRKQKEKDDIANVLDELERSILNELNQDKQPEQLSLFSEDERLQLRRDSEALKARLERLPGERENELQHIDQRYADFEGRTFPVALIFLVPDSAVKAS